MHTVAKPARIKAKNRAEKWAVDEAIRKLALRTAKIKKIQPSYTSGRVAKKSEKQKSAKDHGNSRLSPGRTRDMRKCSI